MRIYTSMPFMMLGAALALSACGGVIEFQDKSALTIEGARAPKPVVKKKRVEVKADKIEINEKIMFAKAKADILPESHSLLDEVVEVIKENKQIKKIAIDGHTSAEGDAEFNRVLSDDRAKAVLKYLTDHGIDADRLQAKGYGPSKPIAGNDTEDEREKNRRVEFNILKQDTTK